MHQSIQQHRIHYLDSLRSLAILALILFHSGMVFVPWGFHIKNPEISFHFVWWMSPLHDLRMPLLFFIAGAVSFYAFGKRSSATYRWERLLRLGIPIGFGMLVIVPPQIYVERLAQGQQFNSGWDFYRTTFDLIPYPAGNLSWHHLWFIVYLLVYAWLASPLFNRLRGRLDFEHWFYRLSHSRWGLMLLSLPILYSEALLLPLFPRTHALLGDWATLVFYGYLFLIGYLLIRRPGFAEQLQQQRWFFLQWMMALLILRYCLFLYPEVLPNELMLRPVFTWVSVLALIGFGKQHLDFSNRLFRYLSKSSYCIYIVHQTWIVVLAYFLVDWPIAISVKFLLLVSAAVVLSFASYEVLRRIPYLRFAVGIQHKKSQNSARGRQFRHIDSNVFQ